MKINSKTSSSNQTSAVVGVCLKHTFYEEVVDTRPEVDFFEVHSENYLSDGGSSLAWLHAIRELYPISLHGVSLSLGTAEGLDLVYLEKLKSLVEKIDPIFLSDHLSWSVVNGTYLNDLLPLPYTKENLKTFVENINKAQDFLGRTFLIENPSSYLSFPNSDYSEPEFLNEIVRQTGCHLLLDVNNIYVSAHNNHLNPITYLNEISSEAVKEMHLAGHDRSKSIYIDDHGCKVQEEVWNLYKFAVDRFGCVPTLIEWDANVPELSVLLGEANKAREILEKQGMDENAA